MLRLYLSYWISEAMYINVKGVLSEAMCINVKGVLSEAMCSEF